MSLTRYLLALCLAIAPGIVQGATINLAKGSGWVEFYFDINQEVGTSGLGAWIDPASDTGVGPLEVAVFAFSIKRGARAYLQVTDAWRAGDQFEVSSNGNSLGLTSAPAAIGNDILGDYSGASRDARWSTGTWLLGEGDYLITGIVRAMPEKRGAGGIRLSAVPIPGSLALMLGTGAVFGATSIRRRKRAASKVTK